ncbi:MAG: ribonuclease catalytic domain-containing protein [Bacilli bacterium]|nr:ribonuclease catalytic domain-containing protein [Bacilli bacterium]MDD4808556.1 ribonuclease catalytic domain-containing protein [Bacilli bacterium]
MKEVKTKIKDLLIQKRKYTFEEMKKEVNITNELELINHLLDFLHDEITNFDFNKPTDDYKYLFKTFKYLEFNFSKLKAQDFNNNIDELKKINNLCNQVLNNRQLNNPDENFYEGKIFLNKIQNNIQVSILGLNFWKKQANNYEEKDQVVHFLNYLIYDVKNYNYLVEIFRTFPNLIELQDETGKKLIKKIFNKYVDTCKNEFDNYNVIYLEKVIKLVIVSSTIKKDKNYQKQIINYLLQEIDNTKRAPLKKKECENITFFLNELIKDIKSKTETNLTEQINNINFKYGITPTFSDEALEQLENYININGKKYLDLTKKMIITIDDNAVNVIDDAVSLEKLKNGNTLLGVYISDVSEYIPYNCLIDREAYKKAETIYLPQNTINMLPRELSNNTLSLKEKENKYAIAYMFEFTPKLICVNFEARQAIIKINKNLINRDVSSILDGQIDDLELARLLESLLTFSEKLKGENIYKQKYHALKKIKRQLDNNLYGKYADNSLGGKIISEIMILTNHFVSNYFDSQKGNIPFLYRVNSVKIDDKIINELKKKKEAECKVDEIVKCIEEIYEPSKYSVENTGHQGLNLTAYCHTTTPIRSYASIITQRAVKEFMIEKKQYTDNQLLECYENLSLMCDHMNKRRELNAYYQQEYSQAVRKNGKKR